MMEKTLGFRNCRNPNLRFRNCRNPNLRFRQFLKSALKHVLFKIKCFVNIVIQNLKLFLL